jgi:uncharacterized DUF497 family protein
MWLVITTKRNYTLLIMKFEWDENKRRTNIRKHGIDFIDAEAVFAGYTITLEDTRVDYGEQRFVTFGFMNGRVVAITHTETEESIRIISIRKASKYEQASYFSRIPD